MGRQNRIVIDYGDYEGLILLSAFNTKTGEEIDRDELEKLTDFDLVKKYDGLTDLTKLKSLEENNKEGFVIRFSNGFRIKVKFAEYVRLHRIITGVSNKTIWEYLSEGKDIGELLDKVPDEFYSWVTKTVKDLETQFELILGEVITDYWDIEDLIIADFVYEEKEYVKRFAEEAFKKKYPHLLFTYRKEMLCPIRIDKAIWKLINPKFQKPFKTEE